MHFGNELRKALKKANMSQSEFAREFGVSRQRVFLMMKQETAYQETIDFVKEILPKFKASGIPVRDKGAGDENI